MPILQDRETDTGQGQQLECRMCWGRSWVATTLDGLVKAHPHWDTGPRGILCPACRAKRPRMGVYVATRDFEMGVSTEPRKVKRGDRIMVPAEGPLQGAAQQGWLVPVEDYVPLRYALIGAEDDWL